ncbi:AAA family ATPase [Rothia sp. CCM 9417]|uniref:AAA family ATPase n=1 Tax=Rothia sp. CCM 9417 TaxID=3402657 RepID=UPI003ADAC283
MMQIPIIVVADEGGRFISAIESQRGHVSVVRHVHDMGEMLGIAQSGIARAVLVVTQAHEMTQSLISSLHQMELSVCIVADTHAPPSLDNVTIVDSLADTQEIVEAIERSVKILLEETETPQADCPPEQVRDLTQAPGAQAQIREEAGSESLPGKLLTVWGPLGAPGTTMLATNLAAAYAEAGYKTCLVDADTYGASAGAVLGLTDDYSSLAQLCHQAERGPVQERHLKELVQTVRHKDSYFDIVTGINRADRWAEIRRTSLAKVYETLLQKYDLVIADTAFCLEEDEALSFDSIAPQRNEASLVSLQDSDGIVLVGLADVVGVPRLIKAYDQLIQTVQPENPQDISIVFNRVRSEAIGPSARLALDHSWQRFGPAHPIDLVISEDAGTADKARLSGKTILEVAPTSQLAKELHNLQAITRARLGLKPGPTPDENGGSSQNVVEKKRLSFRFPSRSRSSS